MSDHDPIGAAVADVRSHIAAACKRAGRRPDAVTLVAVSKTFPAAVVELALRAGATHLGENRVQEAREKRPAVRGAARWHLIGHLQSNKVKEAVQLFDVIETVDSIELAQKLSRAAQAAGKTQEVLLQVNIGQEPQKNGALPGSAPSIAAAMATLPGLMLRGLMAIPPVGDSRPHFRALRVLRDQLGLEHLSMGMSADYEVAIEEGATLVRVGSAIFGSRG
jgi:pyridoxal phosphate enzyme (YggS family)